MKLIFRKDDDLNISVAQKTREKEVEFSYIEMIKNLIVTKKLKAATIEGDFSEAEKQSISSMVTLINDELECLDEEWKDE